MDAFDRQRLLAALTALVVVLFVGSGSPFAGRWRRPLRAAALVVFALALIAALAEIGWWLAIAQP